MSTAGCVPSYIGASLVFDTVTVRGFRTVKRGSGFRPSVVVAQGGMWPTLQMLHSIIEETVREELPKILRQQLSANTDSH